MARQAGKTALIAGNLHPGSAKCNRQWSHRYGALIDAFQDVVRLQMFGNGGSSSDAVEFEIFRELESGNPIGVASIAAEFSP